MKRQSNVTVSKKVSVAGLGKDNMVAPHGGSMTAKGGANYRKGANTIGVEGKGKAAGPKGV